MVQILKKKYGKAPEYTKKARPGAKAKKESPEEAAQGKAVDIRKMDLEDLKAEVYRCEVAHASSPPHG